MKTIIIYTVVVLVLPVIMHASQRNRVIVGSKSFDEKQLLLAIQAQTRNALIADLAMKQFDNEALQHGWVPITEKSLTMFKELLGKQLLAKNKLREMQYQLEQCRVQQGR